MLSSLINRSDAQGDIAKRGELSGQYIQTQTLLSGTKPILALSLSPDEKRLLVAQFSSVVIFDLTSHKITAHQTHISGRILALNWDPRGELAVMGRANGDVFVWGLSNGSYAGKDSIEAVERYEGAYSPIVGLFFHPSGRAFFAAERSGNINFWRLLRTESALGLRDEGAEADQEKRGKVSKKLASLDVEIEDFWLKPDGTVVYVAASDGTVRSYKVRGLKALDKTTVESGAIFSLQGFGLQKLPASNSLSLIPAFAFSGKEQRIKFWCQKVEEKQFISSGSDDNNKFSKGEIAQSAIFRSPLTILRGGVSEPILWAAEKTGNLLTFNANLLVNSPIWLNQIQLCRD